MEFLALLLPHIQHRYQCKTRTYGALSTTMRRRFGWIGMETTAMGARPGEEAGAAGDAHAEVARADGAGSDRAPVPGPGVPAATIRDDADPEPPRARRRGWAHLIRKVWLDDPERCEKCGGTMKIVAALASPGQDDVIRAILESTGQWDPPWMRNARDPPAAVRVGEAGARTADEVDRSDRDELDPPERTIEYDVDPEHLDDLWPDAPDDGGPTGADGG